MLFLALAFYFVLAVIVATFLFLPDLRNRALRRGVAGVERLLGVLAGIGIRGRRGMRSTSRAASSVTLRLRDTLVRRRLILAASASILAVPPLLALALHGRRIFAYDSTASLSDEKIDALLSGEQLVPPPAPPPEVFSTREVEMVRPTIRLASRDWNLLDADFRNRLLLVYKIMAEEHGYQLVLLEGYRSPERQAKLAQMGSHVTQAGAYQSYHQYGLAADNAFMRDGKVVISEKDPWAMRGYQLYGEAAERVGLVWGGRWKMMDLGHVEYHKPGFVLGKRKAANGVME